MLRGPSTDPLDASPPTTEFVVLVDERDLEVGVSEKLAAHRGVGRLHRAFSVFLFDGRGRMLLQRRAAGKYHFPMLWTNACCGHPRPGESVVAAATRRVNEELGVSVETHAAFSFRYVAHDAVTGLSEREYDHVLIGRLEEEPYPCPEEVAEVAWREPVELLRDVSRRPHLYTPWFAEALAHLERHGVLAPETRLASGLIG